MDFSWKYVNMCIAASELQLVRPIYWEAGDFYWISGEKLDLTKPNVLMWDVANYIDGGTKQRREHYQVWLPRLDQLACMLENWNHNYSMAFFEDMAINSKYHPIEITNACGKKLCCESLEQHVLHRVLYMKYGKVWNEETKHWIEFVQNEIDEGQ